jgi:hypothetical protein
MQRFICTAIIFILFLPAFSQDVITLLNGDEIKAKVTDITPTEVYYLLPAGSVSQPRTLGKWLVMYIRYNNGSEDSDVYKDVTDLSLLSDSDICNKARTDAGIYYDYSSPAAKSFLGSLLLTPVIGYFTADLINKTVPLDDDKLNIPRHEFVTNNIYQYCYRNEAIKIKKKQVWGNFWKGAICEVTIVGIYLFIRHNNK